MSLVGRVGFDVFFFAALGVMRQALIMSDCGLNESSTV